MPAGSKEEYLALYQAIRPFVICWIMTYILFLTKQLCHTFKDIIYYCMGNTIFTLSNTSAAG